MRWCGYLWCFTKEAYDQMFPVLEELKVKGFLCKEFAAEELSTILGMRISFKRDSESEQLRLNEVFRAVFVPKAGLIGVRSLVHYYESEFLRLGGEIRYRTEVSRLVVEPRGPLGLPGEPYFWQDASIVGGETNVGTIRAKKTVVATGSWLPQLLDPVGVECFVKARKRQVFNIKANSESLKTMLHTNEFSDAGFLPFTILPKPSIYIRPNLEGEGFGVGFADEFPRAYKIEDHPKPEASFYEHGLQPFVAKYFPQFEGAQSQGGFAGMYEINTLDEQPVIFGEHGLVVVGGGSGSGIMKADAIGRIAAAVYAGQEYAVLFGARKLRVSDLGLRERRVEREKLVI